MSQQTKADARHAQPISLKLILILGILSAYGPLTIDLYMPALPTIATEFQTERIQQTMSVFFLGMSLGQLFMGPLSDKFGRKKPLLFGCAIYALASLGCALATSLEGLLFFRFLQALGGCAGMVLTVSMVRDLFAIKDSARVLSYLVLVMGLAPILAPLIGGQLLILLELAHYLFSPYGFWLAVLGHGSSRTSRIITARAAQ